MTTTHRVRRPSATFCSRFEIFPHGFLLYAFASLVCMAIVASPGDYVRRRLPHFHDPTGKYEDLNRMEKVYIHDFDEKSWLNGRTGVVEKFDHNKKAYEIKVKSTAESPPKKWCCFSSAPRPTLQAAVPHPGFTA